MSMQKSSLTEKSPYASMDDNQLVRLAQQGRKDAFSELTNRHYRSTLRLAISILHDREEAEDETQNAWWKAWQHIDQFHIDAKYTTWVTRIVVNQCLMRLRRARRAKFLYIDDVRIGEERGTLELVDTVRSPEIQLGSTELAAVLEKEIRRIPPMLRSVFKLRDVDQLPMPEVAETLGISMAAAKSRLLRARAELRARMEKHCGRMGVGTLTSQGQTATVSGPC